MARHRRFSLAFKQQVVLDFLEKRLGLRELSRTHHRPMRGIPPLWLSARDAAAMG